MSQLSSESCSLTIRMKNRKVTKKIGEVKLFISFLDQACVARKMVVGFFTIHRIVKWYLLHCTAPACTDCIVGCCCTVLHDTTLQYRVAYTAADTILPSVLYSRQRYAFTTLHVSRCTACTDGADSYEVAEVGGQTIPLVLQSGTALSIHSAALLYYMYCTTISHRITFTLHSKILNRCA